MGSKRELLGDIKDLIVEYNYDNKAVLDLFAGTCSVGMVLRDRFPIISNDIQTYSQTISKGVIESRHLKKFSKDEIWNILLNNYSKNYEEVKMHITELLNKSEDFSSIKPKDWNGNHLTQYKQFLRIAPSPEDELRHDFSETKWLQHEYNKRNKDPKIFPYLQTTYLFGEMYFSISQALEIDSLKFAIDNLGDEYSDLKPILEVALLHAHSYASAGTGHFAQFRDLKTLESAKDVSIYRQKKVKDYFLNKALEILNAQELNIFHKKSQSYASNYLDLINNNKIMSNVGIIYADPPYSFVHYSRFYHATENLCRYDYPEVKFKGRYRLDRHQSPFCIKSKVQQAFQSLILASKKYKIPLLMSYSDTGMIEYNKIITLCSDLQVKTKLIELEHTHSTLGRQKDKSRSVSEKLILCY
jgi:adenine-specific DNA-methyltransferase